LTQRQGQARRADSWNYLRVWSAGHPVHAGYLLASTDRLHVINGITQIWSRAARWTYSASTLLADAYPGRHVLGLGFGGKAQPGVSPLAVMTGYLGELDALEASGPVPRATVRRILAAYGPKMLELARNRSAGALTYKVNTEHTAHARQILGPDAFLAVEHAVLFQTDPDLARATARQHLADYLGSHYIRRLGYTDDDLAHGGSDRFVDDLVFWGDPDTIVKKLHAHVEAGADHVAVQVIGIEPGQSASPAWRVLGDALLS
jgi:probable F420-dependent oxidoreductase